jgi:large subunit ribosomal protein L23
MKALHTIIRPVVTEKATKQGEKHIYTFYVNRDATKVDVKQALKELYGHEIVSVRSVNQPVKTRVMRRCLVNKRAEMKKVYVTLKGDKKLDVTKISKESKK